jgi:hypothetical protein
VTNTTPRGVEGVAAAAAALRATAHPDAGWQRRLRRAVAALRETPCDAGAVLP